jgi:import inner membrane translocase subunit TIM44
MLGPVEWRPVVAVPALHHQHHMRAMATEPGKRPSFFGSLVENLKSEYTKSKDMQDSLAKFREEAKRLEESDALKEARRKFQSIEGESSKTGGALKDQLSGLTDKLKDTVDDLSKNEALKKASEFTGNLGEKTKGATESLGKAAEQLSQSSAFQTASKTAVNIKEELEGGRLGGRVYRPPRVLRKRKEVLEGMEKPIEADETTTGVEMHRDSRFSQSWQNFKDSNPVVNKFVDYR